MASTVLSLCQIPVQNMPTHANDSAAVQRAVKAGVLTSADVDSIIVDKVSTAELVSQHDISQLFASPVEVNAFSDEEGVRYCCCEPQGDHDCTGPCICYLDVQSKHLLDFHLLDNLLVTGKDGLSLELVHFQFRLLRASMPASAACHVTSYNGNPFSPRGLSQTMLLEHGLCGC